jgi:hypothetical protein
MLTDIFDLSFKIGDKFALQERLNAIFHNVIDYVVDLAVKFVLYITVLFHLCAGYAKCTRILCNQVLDLFKADWDRFFLDIYGLHTVFFGRLSLYLRLREAIC